MLEVGVVRYPTAMLKPFLLALAGSFVAACASNSDRTYRDVEVSLDSPLALWVLAEKGHEPIDAVLLAEGMQQLEDLVEAAASRVAQRDVDYPSPELGDFDFVAEIDRRGTDEYEEWFFGSLYGDDVGYGTKYLLDHAGFERGADAIDHPRAGELASWVDQYVLDETPRGTIEPELRAVEREILTDLGMTETEWFRNELIFDSAVDLLGAFTEPEAGCPLFPRARIEIPRSMISGSFLELIHTYGHELLHCMAGGFDSESEEHRTIEETACEVFGARVLADVLADRLEDGVWEELDAELWDGLGLVGAEFFVEMMNRIDGVEPPSELDADPETPDDPAVALDLEFARLRELYRHADVEFAAWKKTNDRYGYVEALPGPDDDVAEQIGFVLDAMSIEDYAALMPELTSFEQLRALAARARAAKRLTLEEARATISAPPT